MSVCRRTKKKKDYMEKRKIIWGTGVGIRVLQVLEGLSPG